MLLRLMKGLLGKECWKKQGYIFCSLQKERSPDNTLLLTKSSPLQTSDLQIYKIINSCYFKPQVCSNLLQQQHKHRYSLNSATNFTIVLETRGGNCGLPDRIGK